MIRADLVGLRSDVELELLDEAAGFGVPKALRVQRRPVPDAAVQVPDVHEVEAVDGPGPRHLRVVDLEFAVGGHPGGLDWGDVCADYLRRGELIGEVPEQEVNGVRLLKGIGSNLHSPYAGTSSNIQDVLRQAGELHTWHEKDGRLGGH